MPLPIIDHNGNVNGALTLTDQSYISIEPTIINQTTSINTTVVANNPHGRVNCIFSAIGSNSSETFTFTNSFITTTNIMFIQTIYAGNRLAFVSVSLQGAGTATIRVSNAGAGNLTDAVSFNYILF